MRSLAEAGIIGLHPGRMTRSRRRDAEMITVTAREALQAPSSQRAMSLAFAAGSMGFLLGPFPGYITVVGPLGDAITFFVGSVLFTIGGALQTWQAAPARHAPGAGRSGWEAAVIQSLGTLFFNVTTFRALQTTITSPAYDNLVWRPDAFGSVCFLISGVIVYRASARRGWLPTRGAAGWWQPGINLLGCVLFGVAAVAGYVVPSTGNMLALAAANWTTSTGAACFLACAVGGLSSVHRHEAVA